MQLLPILTYRKDANTLVYGTVDRVLYNIVHWLDGIRQ